MRLALSLNGPSSAPAVRLATLAAFEAVLRERFGLGRMTRHSDALARRLAGAMEACGRGGGDPAAFLRDLASAPDGAPEVAAVADLVPNHETSFFRDAGQLRCALETLVPSRAASLPSGEPLRILCAGCSSGEEVYSLAMLALDAIHVLWGRRVEILGVDLSPKAICAAADGLYRSESLGRAGAGPLDWQRRFLRQVPGGMAVRPLLRDMTGFAVGNLVSPRSLSPLGRFDLVLCRNVLIYFDGPSADRALASLSAALRPGGALVLGHAEMGSMADRVPGLRASAELAWFEPAEVA
jgi:chemotaxis methyl-accepting protein methylase